MASLYDRYVLPRLLTTACGASAITKARARLVPHAEGRVLEVGAGGGLNFVHYDPRRVTRVDGIDPSAELLARAAAAKRAPGLRLGLRPGVAEALPYPDGVFDTVLFTFTLCSVRSPEEALAEARRVLRQDGLLLFCEHGLAPDEGVARWQRRLEPLWRHLAGGCRLTRSTTPLLGPSGFAPLAVEEGYLPGAPRLAGWCARGSARAV